MKRTPVIRIAIAVVVVAASAVGIYFLAAPAPPAAALDASGFVEAEEISLAPEIGGRIVAIPIAEGDPVAAGQPLVYLDDSLAQAQVALAEAGLDVAEAQLAQLRAGARSEQIRQAQAALTGAEAARDGAYQAWQDLLALVANPQDLNAQIALAEAQVAQAQAALNQAIALKDAAQIAQDAYDSAVEQHPPGTTERIQIASGPLAAILPTLPPDLAAQLSGGDGTYTSGDLQAVLSGGNVTVYALVAISYPLQVALTPNTYWQAWVGVNTAQAGYDGARQALNLLYELRRNPLALQAEADAAEAGYREADAAVEMARAQLDGLRAGATSEEIAAAEAQVQQAQAQLDSAHTLLDKLVLVAPSGGQILDVVGHPGELAAPGVPVVTLADLEQVTLTIYVPENRLGEIQIGQRVEVRVDSFPDRVFIGQIAAIASAAEFLPRNVQTRDERVNMVFAVKVTIPNPDSALKPGIPADARIITSEATK